LFKVVNAEVRSTACSKEICCQCKLFTSLQLWFLETPGLQSIFLLGLYS